MDRPGYMQWDCKRIEGKMRGEADASMAGLRDRIQSKA
jgi:hypothetical protein